MNRQSQRHRIGRREGSALLIALLALAGLSILGLSLMLVTDTELQVSNDERLRKQALYAAEAGVEHALVFMRGIEPASFGVDTGGGLGLLSGSNANDAPTDPPDEDQSYNEAIKTNENLYDPTKPWKAPALARKGHVLYFETGWFSAGFPNTPANGYSMRDIPFERSAGAAAAFDVGSFKSRYSVYVKSNLDDPVLADAALGGNPRLYEYDTDQTVVLTSEGIVDVLPADVGGTGTATRGGIGGIGYKVVRTVEVTVKTGRVEVNDESGNVAGATGNAGKLDQFEKVGDNTGQVSGQNQGW